MDSSIKWFEMSICEQLGNVGSEVNRAISWKNRGNEQRKIGFCNKAIEFLQIIKQDPKNIHRCRELDSCIEELEDFFLGNNSFNTTDEVLLKYYNSFI